MKKESHINLQTILPNGSRVKRLCFLLSLSPRTIINFFSPSYLQSNFKIHQKTSRNYLPFLLQSHQKSQDRLIFHKRPLCKPFWKSENFTDLEEKKKSKALLILNLAYICGWFEGVGEGRENECILGMFKIPSSTVHKSLSRRKQLSYRIANLYFPTEIILKFPLTATPSIFYFFFSLIFDRVQNVVLRVKAYDQYRFLFSSYCIWKHARVKLIDVTQ